MPLKIENEGGSTEYSLDTVTFNEGINNYFLASTIDESIQLSFDYIPPLEKWDHTKYEMYLFENVYLNAENDIFEIYIKAISSERMGWIFPITILESEEGDFKESSSKNKTLNGYRFVAFHKLLLQNKTLNLEKGKISYKISDIYDDATIICLMSKEAVKERFNIYDYILSFHCYGYSIFKEYPRCIPFSGNSIVEDIRGIDNIKLKKSNFDICSNEYIKGLFEDYLIFNNDGLVRFIFLYQIIEYFIKIEYDYLFNEYVGHYQNGIISINDFREKINNLGTEKIRIGQVFNNANISQELKEKFEKDCISLFNDMSYVCDDKFPIILYILRNRITHEYRNLLNYKDHLNDVIYLFEKVIIELLMTYNDKKKAKEVDVKATVTKVEEKEDIAVFENNFGINPIENEIYKIQVPKLSPPKVIGKIELPKDYSHSKSIKKS